MQTYTFTLKKSDDEENISQNSSKSERVYGKLSVKQRLWQWFVITLSNHTIISIFWRDRKYSRKEKDGSEKYTTCERLAECIFYITLLLCLNLTIGMGVAAINVNCSMSSTAYSDCFFERSEATRSLCSRETNNVLTRDKWIVPPSKKFTIGSKHYKFRLFKELRPSWYFTFDKNTDTNATAIQSSMFEQHEKSFVCVDATGPLYGQRIYCLHPSQVCTLNTNPPSQYNPMTVARFILLQIAVTIVSQIGICICITPLSSLLMLLFVGVCEPEQGHPLRKTYKGTIVILTTFAFIFMAAWVFFSLFLTFYFFSNVNKETLASTIATAFIIWLSQITIFDFLSSCTGALFNFPKVVLCGIPIEDGLSRKKSVEEKKTVTPTTNEEPIQLVYNTDMMII